MVCFCFKRFNSIFCNCLTLNFLSHKNYTEPYYEKKESGRQNIPKAEELFICRNSHIKKIIWQSIKTNKKYIWYCTYKVFLSKFSLHKRLCSRISEQERYLILHLQFKTRDLASRCFCVISTWHLVLSQMSMF